MVPCMLTLQETASVNITSSSFSLEISQHPVKILWTGDSLMEGNSNVQVLYQSISYFPQATDGKLSVPTVDKIF